MFRPLKLASTLLTGMLLAAAVHAQDTAPKPAADATPTSPTAAPALVKVGTTLGTITLELDAAKAPLSVANFLQYAQEGFYNGTVFHRVMSDFMIQGGQYTVEMDLKEDGLHEPVKNEWTNGLKNTRGTIAMARLGRQPDSATAQFFINVVDNATLDKPADGAGYAVFGKVVEGMDVVDAIKNAKVARHPKYPYPQPVTPEVPVVINSVKLANDFSLGALQASIDAARAAEEELKLAPLKAAIAKMEKDSGTTVTTTASGLMYVILKPGSGPQPTRRNTIKAHYIGTYLNGETFDSSVERGEPLSIGVGDVIPGWTEALLMMHVGEKRIIICPPDLGYNDGQYRVFEMELLEIVK